MDGDQLSAPQRNLDPLNRQAADAGRDDFREAAATGHGVNLAVEGHRNNNSSALEYCGTVILSGMPGSPMDMPTLEWYEVVFISRVIGK